MKTEKRFIDALKDMMQEMPLEEISVLALSKRCHVKRQTFYYHFHDIYDLLMVVFLDEKIPGLDDAVNLDDVLVSIYDYYSKNKGFIDATIIGAGKDLFIEFVQNSIYQCFLRNVNDYDSKKVLTSNEKKAICRYHSHAIANVFEYYLETHKNKNLNDLKNQFLFMNKTFLNDSVKEAIKKKN
ncbi:MAG: TetR/AcrR family transcriptional regulator C-terminal domain-containing protein [Coprobacillus sp.]|nr:TetR/AcrR family transcriptional regulator C-terminal domain-containing protein [Coprobacillus sp.]